MSAAKKTLIPPLQLYRQILRAHRVHLPAQFRILGDGYVKAEFHRHKNVDNPLYIVGFLEQWKDYLDHILSNAPAQQQQQQQQQQATTASFQVDTQTEVGSAPSIASSSSSTTTAAATPEEIQAQTLNQIVDAAKPFGKRMDPALLEIMSEQQLGQLYELRKETKGLQTEQELQEIAQEEARMREKMAATN